MWSIEKILDLKVVELRFAECIEEGLGWVESVKESFTKFGIGGSINNTIRGIGETQRAVVISILTLICLRNKD